jgi:hypothetical protein
MRKGAKRKADEDARGKSLSANDFVVGRSNSSKRREIRKHDRQAVPKEQARNSESEHDQLSPSSDDEFPSVSGSFPG